MLLCCDTAAGRVVGLALNFHAGWTAGILLDRRVNKYQAIAAVFPKKNAIFINAK